MQKAIIWHIILLATFVVNIYAAEENLMINPGFESGFSGWDKVFKAELMGEKCIQDSEELQSEKYSAVIGGEEINFGRRLEQFVPVEPNTNYLFAFWVKSEGDKDQKAGIVEADKNKVYVVIKENISDANPKGTIAYYIDVNPDKKWGKRSYLVKTSPQTHFLIIRLYAEMPGYVWYDDTSLIKVKK